MVPVIKDRGRYRPFGKVYFGKIHNSHDYDIGQGAKVYNVHEGVVIFCGMVNGFGGINPSKKGWVVLVEVENDGHKYTIMYGHCKPYALKKGDKVGYMQVIGEVDSYIIGGENVPHLHFGVWAGGGKPKGNWGYVEHLRNWINPKFFLKNILGEKI